MQVAVRPVVIGSSALLASGLIAVTPVVSPPVSPRVSDANVRLTTSATDAIDALLSGLAGGTPVASLSTLTGDLTTINDSLGLTSLLGVADTGLSNLSSLLTELNFGNLVTGIDLGGLQNIPYNIIADIFNIPYTESLALQEYAYALGPAGSEGGVAGWIPPGATLSNGGVDVTDGQEYYALGGTGSWWQESMGNTWGWDNGNWPQVDALIHFVLPLQWTEGLTQSIQSVAQSSFIDGSAVNCEFECANVVGYLGGWLTHLGNVFSSTYPVTQTDTIGQNVGGVINVGPPGFEESAIWSGQQVPINPLTETFQAIWQNAIENPSSNPIELPNLDSLLTNAELFAYDVVHDFNPFIEGSFLYWGAPTLYSIPALIGGLVHTSSLGLIPNEFANTAIGWPANGAMPVDGYSMGPASLPGNLAEGFTYLAKGLLNYLNPATYLPGAIPGAATDPGATALGALGDPTALLGDLNSLLPNLETDLTSMLGPNLGADLATMFPQLATDLGSWFPDLASTLVP
jgi:hypothetical protein